MNLAGLDMNLVVALRALLTERNVTRAGERIGLSQPATSAAPPGCAAASATSCWPVRAAGTS